MRAHMVCLFPKNMAARSLKYLLSEYYGLDKKQIAKIKKLNARWVAITRTYPAICIYGGSLSHGGGCYLLSKDDDSDEKKPKKTEDEPQNEKNE